jgi:hypothetical protein
MAERANLETSASGLILSKTLMFSSQDVAVMVDWLLHTCSIVGVENLYNLRIRVKMVKDILEAAVCGTISFDDNMVIHSGNEPSLEFLAVDN